jgi:hypothetical protein
VTCFLQVTGRRILDTREETALVQIDFTNSDIASATYTDTFDRLVRPFAIASGVLLPAGAYGFHNLQLAYSGGQQRKYSGTIAYETGTFYDGDRRSIALNAARMELTPQCSVEPSFSVNRVRLAEGAFTATVVRTRITYTLTPRMYVSGIAQYSSAGTSVGSNVRLRWEYQPGSELFVVYTDDYDTDAQPSAAKLRNRALVIKVNRLFRP